MAGPLPPGIDPRILRGLTPQRPPQPEKPPPFRIRMERMREELAKKLERTNEVIARMDANPELESFIEFVESGVD